ncbi:MAG TPA: hypothetical protein VFU65_00645 [Actinocrinis sp.]|nr:hypothetical protein [Actinocrinis sp.]
MRHAERPVQPVRRRRWGRARDLLGSLFWTRRWFRVTKQRLPEPASDETDKRYTLLNYLVVLGPLALAYALFPREQVQSVGDLAGDFVLGFTLRAWILNAAVAAVAYLLLALSVQVYWRVLLRPMLYVLHPMVLSFGIFFAAVYPLQQRFVRQMAAIDPNGPTLPQPLTEHAAVTFLLWVVLGWFMTWPFFGFVYSAYRASKYHFFAPDLHPVLAPLVELALAARGLAVAVEGKATVLNLSVIPSRLIASTAPLLATVYFAYRATDTQRTLLHQQGSGLRRQIGRLGGEVGDSGRPVRKRLRSLWDFRRTQSGRLGLGLFTVAVGTVLLANVGPA